jgi:hypothetical protein
MNIFNFLYDKNARNEAIARMRGSGSVVPKKVTGKYIYNLEEAKLIDAIPKGNNVLIIYDFNKSSEADLLVSQLIELDSLHRDNNYFPYPKSINLTKYNDTTNTNGNIFLQEIHSYIGTINNDTLQYDYIYKLYDGSDLTISNYGVVILCTLNLPIYFRDVTGKNILITTNNYNPENKNITDPNGNNYYQVQDNYSEKFGINLQKYINSGGNVIMGNNIWQTSRIPNFKYQNIPILYDNLYQYNEVDLKNINFKNQHPIFKNCTSNIEYNNVNTTKPYIITNMQLDIRATLLATAKYNNTDIPFIATNVSSGGSRSVAINSYIYRSSSVGNSNLELVKIIYNSIYWCFKINV